MDFEGALKALDEAGVSFIIIGAVAAVAHGSSHVTRDLAICYERTQENMRRFVTALAPLHPSLRGAPKELPFVLDERTLAQGMNFTFRTELGDIDLLGELSGVGQYSELVQGAENRELWGRNYKVVSLSDLIRSKRTAGRAKDLSILPELEALQELQAAQQEVNKKRK
jgi:predicted nucleotidyltransferase